MKDDKDHIKEIRERADALKTRGLLQTETSVALHSDIPWLLERVEELEGECSQLTSSLDEASNPDHPWPSRVQVAQAEATQWREKAEAAEAKLEEALADVATYRAGLAAQTSNRNNWADACNTAENRAQEWREKAEALAEALIEWANRWVPKETDMALAKEILKAKEERDG